MKALQKQSRLGCERILVLACVIGVSLATIVSAQDDGGGGRLGGGGGRSRRGGRGGMDPEMYRQFRERFRQRAGGGPETPGAPNPNSPPGQPAQGEKKDDGKTPAPAATPKPDPGPPPITRPAAYENFSSFSQQRLSVDDKRMVTFSFQEAPWAFVLEEVARVSGMNLDWQQLPGDAVNLRSNTKYTVAQARDLINEHLMARGYSMLVKPKQSTITVVNLETLNTALVPRVAPEDLDKFEPHDLVKVSFRLDWLLADQAAQEFKTVLSARAKLLPLKTTNRLEAIDAVENLKQLAEILDEEQGRGGRDRLVKEFDLRYTRAPEILEQLEAFLGMKKEAAAAASANPRDAARQMFFQRMTMGSGGSGADQQPAASAPGGSPKPDVRLIANQRHNTILVNAPPDLMAIIKDTIFKLDVPPEGTAASRVSQTMQVYRLATADPEVVVNVLDAMGELDPQTKLEVDKKNRTVVAVAGARDHATISNLVKNLDGSDRKLKVIQLHALDASLVAGTLRNLLAGDAETKATAAGNADSFGFDSRGWGFGRGRGRGRGFGWSEPAQANNNQEASTGTFRVDADSANNRLILWANKVELEQVEACLAELGEIPSGASGRERGDSVRFLDLGNGADQEKFIERLRLLWPAINKDGGKLIIDVPAPSNEPGKEPAKEVPNAKQGAGAGAADPPRGKGNVSAPAAAPSTKSLTPKSIGSRPVAAGETDQSPDRTAFGSDGSTQAVGAPLSLIKFSRTALASEQAAVDSETQKAPTSLAQSEPRSRRGRGRPRSGVRPMPEPGVGQPAPEPGPGPGPLERAIRTAAPPAPPQPVFITRSPDGRLVIASRDPQALDTIEKLAGRLGPPRKDYSIITLKFATAASVKYNLDQFFSSEGSAGYRASASASSGSEGRLASTGLSQRRPLRFIDDAQTNSILVQGATADQLRLIGDLIALYDRPEQPNSKVSRMTKIFPIVHSKASLIADTLKDVYRDLLSANDKALEGFNQAMGQGRGARVPFFDASEDESRISQGRFKGQLSLGVDDISNRLLVSCPEALMHNIERIVSDLDHGATPAEQSMHVVRIDRSIDPAIVQKKLMDLLKKPASTVEETRATSSQQPARPQQQPQRSSSRRGSMSQFGTGSTE